MIELFNKTNGERLGEISDADLQFLIDNLEEENLTDDDYYLNQTTFEMLKDKGMSAELSGLIEGAMDEKGEVEIQYRKSG